MRWRLGRAALLLTVVFACAAGGRFGDAHASFASSFVTHAGATLQLDGEPFRFTGLNIYNANSNGLCWYPMDTQTLDQSLSAIGPGKQVFRSWFFQQLATANGARDWTAFDRTLAAARAHGMKVVATLTDQWGNCGSSTAAGGYKDVAWYEGGYKQQDPAGTVSYRDWVTEIVSRYKDDPTILAWQLVNEPEVMPQAGADCSLVPESRAATDLKAFAADVSGLIKSIDPNHLVSLGTIGSGQCGAQSDDFADVMSVPTLDLCEFHDYNPNALVPGDQWNGLRQRIDQCRALGKPLVVGEMGVHPNDVSRVDDLGLALAARARTFDAKLFAQFQAGVVGVLAWNWDKNGSLIDNYDIGPGDPSLDVLANVLRNLDDTRRLTATVFGAWQAQYSPDGRHIAYYENTALGPEELHVMNADGTSDIVVSHSVLADQQEPFDWSPDSTTLLFENTFLDGVPTNDDIFTVRADGSGLTRLTNDSASYDGGARWSPDGSKIVFVSDRGNTGAAQIYTMSADGSNVRRLTDPATTPRSSSPNWSPDGTRIAYVAYVGGLSKVAVMNADGSAPTILPMGLEAIEPAWSPDGTKLAFLSLLDSHLYVANADGSNVNDVSRSIVPMFGGFEWAPHGSRLTFWTDDTAGDGSQTIDVFVANADGTGRLNITSMPSSNSEIPHWSPDGRRILFDGGRDNPQGEVYEVVLGAAPTRITAPVAPGGTVATPAATALDPVGVSVTSPAEGIVAVKAEATTGAPPAGYAFFGREVVIEAPTATAATPLKLTFEVDQSLIPAGTATGTVTVFRNGTPLARCVTAGSADPDPCLATAEPLPAGGVRLTAYTSHASTWNIGRALDTMPPTITITAPAASGQLILNAKVSASFTCSDDVSGVASCTGSTPSGALLDTSSVGPKTLTVTARDNAGNTTSVARNYTVVYDWRGLQTVPPTVALAGRPVVAAFSLGGDQGIAVLAPGSPTSHQVPCGTTGTPGAATATVAAIPLRYEALLHLYVYVWQTQRSWSGTCRQLTVTLADGTAHSTSIRFAR